jgi:hypothetical protein
MRGYNRSCTIRSKRLLESIMMSWPADGYIDCTFGFGSGFIRMSLLGFMVEVALDFPIWCNDRRPSPVSPT